MHAKARIAQQALSEGMEQQTQSWQGSLWLAGHCYPILHLDGREELSKPFCLKVSLLADYNLYADLDALLLFPAQLHLINSEQGERIWSGIVSKVDCQACPSLQAAKINVTLAPRLALLKQHSEAKIFCNKTLPDIVSSILLQHGYQLAQLQLHLINEYLPMAYCLQAPSEMDFDFLQKILANAGIFYWFDHQNGLEIIHFSDHNLAGAVLSPLAYCPFQGGAQQHAYLTSIKLSLRATPSQITIQDFNEELPNTIINGQYGDIAGDIQSYFGLGTYTQAAALQKAKQLYEQAQTKGIGLQGNSQAVMLKPGLRLPLEINGFASDFSHNYFISKVRHFLKPDSENHGLIYHNHSHFLPLKNSFRPPIPKPDSLPLFFSAHVTNREGGSVMDNSGRYYIQYLFTVKQMGEMPPWRSIAPFGADPAHHKAIGWHMPFTAGAEVIVNCINGDVNRPLIIGACYDGERQDPVTIQNKAQHIIETTKGNRLLLDETIGAEVINLQTPQAYNKFELNAYSQQPYVDITSLAGDVNLFAKENLQIATNADINEYCAKDRDDVASQALLVMTQHGEIHYQVATDLNYQAMDIAIEAGDLISYAADNISIKSTDFKAQAETIVLTAPNILLKGAANIILQGVTDAIFQIGQQGTGISIIADGTINCYGNSINFNGKVSYHGVVVEEGGAGLLTAAVFFNAPFPLTLGDLPTQGSHINLQEDVLQCEIDHDVAQTLPVYKKLREKTLYSARQQDGHAIDQGLIDNQSLQPLLIALHKTISLKSNE